MTEDNFTTFVNSVVKHPLLVIRFKIDEDLSMVFHVTEENEQLAGIGLTPVRRSKGANFIRMHPDILTRVFTPVITPVDKTNWLLKIEPLTEEIRIQKRPNGKYICFYPFKEQGRSGQIQEVWVDGTRPPNLKLWFSIHATFQAAKTAPKQFLECRVDCPDDFTNRLFRATTQQ